MTSCGYFEVVSIEVEIPSKYHKVSEARGGFLFFKPRRKHYYDKNSSINNFVLN